ncbi:type III-A CRISPR-associated protein Cas10/Csm1 [Fusobacterium pseudoperiodonticum]|uniref:type III-A CRISPR-associated protein Cas10/Csm1 n=1 Tax=Fusobacterium pseudoperiodonticum TaxID=2663009 RepID=UPI000C1B382B|nr:type III-A CRISPR-associated protein Cas10/Csm1 [Fusobacterium pseudoperiodonticum]ATV68996.1 type III-A CRISPR-associated protein Cas10/Csm1 [Fusobacterium pseudoperiodonticum]PIM78048.1 type III-A CRISPR-associated protein Cas10/Csm1 [Fusobacterium pseudoperiodonticum]
MDEKLICLQLGALLHDIGKIVRRAGLDKNEHSIAGSNYLKENNLLVEKYKEVYDVINYHHAKYLSSAKLKDDSLAYIVYEADNIASGIDRVKYEDKGTKGNEMDNLNSIFNVVKVEKNNIKKTFKLFDFDKNNFNMPTSHDIKLTNSDYKRVLDYIKNNLSSFKENINPEKLAVVLEACCTYFPSSSYVDTPDVSYYDHVKLTAAVAACFYLYDKEKEIKDYKKEYFSKADRNTKKFLLVSGEFSGIQNFIYTISSKMAMKSLRGRSFYLELFAEHIIDEILSELELSRVNLLYSGGSHFYLLLPNTEKSKEVLEQYKEKINSFILEKIGPIIYFEMVYTETSAEELGNGLSKDVKDENKIGELFKKTSAKVSKEKLNRYSLDQLKELLDEDSSINEIKSYTKECNICKKAEDEKILENNAKHFGDEDGIELCDSCKGYINLGKDISKLYHTNDKFVIEKDCEKFEKGVIFPKYLEGYISILINDKNYILKNMDKIHRYYAINSNYTGDKLCKNIWVGNYNITVKDESGKENLIEFKNLVKKSKGIERLAVFRADVDNLGTLFQSGFENKDSKEPYKNVTLSKSVVLSRYLSDFFKRKINLILEKKDAIKDTNELFKKYCDIICEDNSNPRDIVIVYSGGDDVFAIGTWNDIIEFSVDLRTAFKEFTNDKITLSAGIGFFYENYPIHQMAEKTGNLESLAKANKDSNGKIIKNSVALFGEISPELNHIYNWDIFINKVLNEKYKFIKDVTILNEETKEKYKDRIVIGRSKWYKLMDLIVSRLTRNDNKLDIARFAYVLGRINHTTNNKENYDKFKKNLLLWLKNKEDAKQVLTAINILIYQERGE